MALKHELLSGNTSSGDRTRRNVVRIGVIGQFLFVLDSLKYNFTFIERALASRHEMIYLPREYFRLPNEGKEEILREWLMAPEILIGELDPVVARVRNTMDRRVPYFLFVLGYMPRGGLVLRNISKYLTSQDPLISHCVADVELTHIFFDNARTGLLPYAYDDSLFYPMDTVARNDIRARMGFAPDDKILLYAGRMTVEKNVHTLLRVFSLVQKAMPNAHLILAGSAQNVPFLEFGVTTPSIKRMLLKMANDLEIPAGKIFFVGRKDGVALRDLYNIADLLINLTLHHDENFGLAQVESMACGTPVVATNWGGLKDTIIEGETGVRISTVVTNYGVKVDWYQAVSKTLALLNNQPMLLRMSKNCAEMVPKKYSIAALYTNLETILTESCNTASAPLAPLQTTEFAKRIWQCLGQIWDDGPVYRRDSEAYTLYRKLISSYSGLMPEGDCDEGFSSSRVLCLSNPVVLTNQGTVMAEDPIFPFEIELPDHLQQSVLAVADVMTKMPLLTVESLIGECSCPANDVMDAVRYMVEAGIIVASMAKYGAVDGRTAAHLGTPLLKIHALDSDTDVVFTR
jgi:glycosyltransferase involved in cell wall biosynthesis